MYNQRVFSKLAGGILAKAMLRRQVIQQKYW